MALQHIQLADIWLIKKKNRTMTTNLCFQIHSLGSSKRSVYSRCKKFLFFFKVDRRGRINVLFPNSKLTNNNELSACVWSQSPVSTIKIFSFCLKPNLYKVLTSLWFVHLRNCCALKQAASKSRLQGFFSNSNVLW